MRRILLAVFTLGSIASTGCSPDTGLPSADLVLHDVTVLSPSDGTAEPGRSVFVTGDRIVAIVPSGEGRDLPASTEVDARGKYLLPGMWDLHSHLSFADPNAGPLLVTQGVTGVRDMGAVPSEIEEIRRRFARGDVIGPRVLRAGPALNGAVFGNHQRLIDSPRAARRAVAELDSAGVDVLKTHNATSRETYFALLDAADAVGLEVVGHVPVSVAPLEACERGQGSVDHIATIFEGTYAARFPSQAEAFLGMDAWLSTDAPTLVECFLAEGTMFVPTLYTYHFRAHRAELYDDPPDGLAYLSASGRAAYQRLTASDADRRAEVIEMRAGLVDVGKSLTRMLHDAGARIGTGTDFAGPGPVPGFSLRHEVELLAEAGLPPHAAIWAAVRGPGAAQGADPLTGHVEVGAPADLLLLDADPFEDLRALSAIAGVGLRGRWLDRAYLDRLLEELAAG